MKRRGAGPVKSVQRGDLARSMDWPQKLGRLTHCRPSTTRLIHGDHGKVSEDLHGVRRLVAPGDRWDPEGWDHRVCPSGHYGPWNGETECDRCGGPLLGWCMVEDPSPEETAEVLAAAGLFGDP